MSAVKDGGPAFPQKEPLTSDCQGMSLRDHFAGLAMQARISDYESCMSLMEHVKKHGISFAAEVATQAYDMADAMLAQREKGSAA